MSDVEQQRTVIDSLKRALGCVVSVGGVRLMFSDFRLAGGDFRLTPRNYDNSGVAGGYQLTLTRVADSDPMPSLPGDATFDPADLLALAVLAGDKSAVPALIDATMERWGLVDFTATHPPAMAAAYTGS